MDEAQTSYFGFAMLRVANVHLAFKLQDAARKAQWSRWWTLHINHDPSKVCLAKNCRIRPKHRIMPRYQNLQDQTKTAAGEVKIRLIFLTTVFARTNLWLRVEDTDSWSNLDTFLLTSQPRKGRNSSEGISALLPGLLTWSPSLFGTPALVLELSDSLSSDSVYPQIYSSSGVAGPLSLWFVHLTHWELAHKGSSTLFQVLEFLWKWWRQSTGPGDQILCCLGGARPTSLHGATPFLARGCFEFCTVMYDGDLAPLHAVSSKRPLNSERNPPPGVKGDFPINTQTTASSLSSYVLLCCELQLRDNCSSWICRDGTVWEADLMQRALMVFFRFTQNLPTIGRLQKRSWYQKFLKGELCVLFLSSAPTKLLCSEDDSETAFLLYFVWSRIFHLQ